MSISNPIDFTHVGEVLLDDWRLKVRGPVRTEVVNVHARKVNIGETGPDDHPLNSTIIVKNWVGGGQAYDAQEDTDLNRFYWSTCMTQYPGFLTLPPKTYSFDRPSGVSEATPVALGDFPNVVSGYFYASWGTKLCRFNPISSAFDVMGTMANPAATLATVYTITAGVNAGQTKMWIPQGSTFDVWDGTTVTAGTGGAVDFAVWDDKLFKIDNAGIIQWTNDGGISWTTIARVPDGAAVRHLLSFVGPRDEPLLYVITGGRVYSLNFDGGKLVSTKLFYPQHPKQGLGADVFQGKLYVSVGIGVHGYDLSNITPDGLDRDRGLPPEYRGFITSFAQSYNGLFALIQGEATGATATDFATLDVGGGDDTLYGTAGESYSVLMMKDQNGWHYRWAGVGGNPTNVFVSQANDLHRVWFGAAGKMHRQNLPYVYFNPGDPEDVNIEFESESEHITSWYDWNWAGQTKLLKSIEIKMKSADDNNTVAVYYQLDDDTHAWVLAGIADSEGEFFWKVGVDILRPTMKDGSTRYIGEPHERIRLRFVFKRHSDYYLDENGDPILSQPRLHERPVLEWFTIVGRRVLNPQLSLRFTADLTQQRDPWPPAATFDKLMELSKNDRAVNFQWLDRELMVEVVAVNGDVSLDQSQGTGFQSFQQVHLIAAFEERTHGN